MFTVSIDPLLKTKLAENFDEYYDQLLELAGDLFDKVNTVQCDSDKVASLLNRKLAIETEILLDVAFDYDIGVVFRITADVIHRRKVNLRYAKSINFYVGLCETYEFPGTISFQYKDQMH